MHCTRASMPFRDPTLQHPPGSAAMWCEAPTRIACAISSRPPRFLRTWCRTDCSCPRSVVARICEASNADVSTLDYALSLTLHCTLHRNVLEHCMQFSVFPSRLHIPLLRCASGGTCMVGEFASLHYFRSIDSGDFTLPGEVIGFYGNG
jgi:hypothetical protein